MTLLAIVLFHKRASNNRSRGFSACPINASHRDKLIYHTAAPEPPQSIDMTTGGDKLNGLTLPENLTFEQLQQLAGIKPGNTEGGAPESLPS